MQPEWVWLDRYFPNFSWFFFGKKNENMLSIELTFDLEFGVPGVVVPPGIVGSLTPWPALPFVWDVLNVDTDDCAHSTGHKDEGMTGRQREEEKKKNKRNFYMKLMKRAHIRYFSANYGVHLHSCCAWCSRSTLVYSLKQARPAVSTQL